MSDPLAPSCTAFEGPRRLASGSLSEVARAVKAAVDGGSLESLLVFDDASGQAIDFDLRGAEADVIARLPALAARLTHRRPSYCRRRRRRRPDRAARVARSSA